MLSAYMPGPFSGATNDGRYVSPYTPEINEAMRRNTYSTKFITLESIATTSGRSYGNPGFQIQAEGESQQSIPDVNQRNFRNVLDATKVDLDVTSIKY